MKKILLIIGSALLLLFLFVKVVQGVNYPDYTNYTNDFAHVLSQNFVNDLNKKLSDYDKQTTNQIAVVTVKTTSPETIEEYSIHLADKWKPGQKGKDNGIIM